MGLEKLLPTSLMPVTNWSAASHFTWARGEVLILLPINTSITVSLRNYVFLRGWWENENDIGVDVANDIMGMGGFEN
ncbi:hypothetical protein PIB30_036907 [Stylosanthes scabra]|uniref:Uncharacterized protein n=1 Tax=Stylosanthes scabra TaxID=79078 RepID=A0ABU6ZAI1_9FABA|nr:hypothetical protein [Stylosanthes scabra]